MTGPYWVWRHHPDDAGSETVIGDLVQGPWTIMAPLVPGSQVGTAKLVQLSDEDYVEY
jgi:hypothetical protein